MTTKTADTDGTNGAANVQHEAGLRQPLVPATSGSAQTSNNKCLATTAVIAEYTLYAAILGLIAFSEIGYGFFNDATENESFNDFVKAVFSSYIATGIIGIATPFNFVAANIIDPGVTILMSANIKGDFIGGMKNTYDLVAKAWNEKQGWDRVGYVAGTAASLLTLGYSFMIGSASPWLGLLDPNAHVPGVVAKHTNVYGPVTYTGQVFTYACFYGNEIFGAYDRIAWSMTKPGRTEIRRAFKNAPVSTNIWFFTRTAANIALRPWSFLGIMKLAEKALGVNNPYADQPLNFIAVVATVYQAIMCQTVVDFNKTYKAYRQPVQTAGGGEMTAVAAGPADLEAAPASATAATTTTTTTTAASHEAQQSSCGARLGRVLLYMVGATILYLRGTNSIVLLTGDLTPDQYQQRSNQILAGIGLVLGMIYASQYVIGNVYGGFPNELNNIKEFFFGNNKTGKDGAASICNRVHSFYHEDPATSANRGTGSTGQTYGATDEEGFDTNAIPSPSRRGDGDDAISTTVAVPAPAPASRR